MEVNKGREKEKKRLKEDEEGKKKEQKEKSMKVGRCNSNEKRKRWQGVKARSLGCYSILQASSNSSHPSSTLPSPGQARPKNLWAKGGLTTLASRELPLD